MLLIMAVIQCDTDEDWLICFARQRDRFVIQLNLSGFIIMLQTSGEFTRTIWI